MSEAALRSWGETERGNGPFPERRRRPESASDRFLLGLLGRLYAHRAAPRRCAARFADLVDREAQDLSAMSLGGLSQAAQVVRPRLVKEGFAERLVARAFALVREASSRVLGLRHYEVQLMGGWVMLNGMLAEMVTGEGKTITAALPVVTAALAGIPVHVITVNDYLARRDAEQLRPLFEVFGLSVGLIQQGMDVEERRKAYGCHITYCTNKELVFDYLRDRLALDEQCSRPRLALRKLADRDTESHRLRLNGLHFGIVDEADSILIDEARTPLIISGERSDLGNADQYRLAFSVAGSMNRDQDFRITAQERSIVLTEAGRNYVKELSQGLPPPWNVPRAREELIQQALAAIHLFHRDQHYLVDEGKIKIVDEYTGRLMPDRSWERSLHQMIELKEACDITAERQTLARITYQRFFRRYLHLAGMTGTAREVAGELWSVYGLRVVRIPTHRPLKRRDLGLHIFAGGAQKWQAVAQRVGELAVERGRPVLIGTRSVAASEHLSQQLKCLGIAHTVLNAKQDRDEAEIVARAGIRGRVTVATNMAGRGTDILLGEGVVELGGLHVVLTEFHEATRTDRQLFGRAGRQGDPGSYEAIASLEDELFEQRLRNLAGALRKLFRHYGGAIPRGLAGLMRLIAQARAERLHSRIRRENVEQDRKLDQRLAFAGARE